MSQSMDKEIETRLNDENWDRKISNRVFSERKHRKRALRNRLVAFFLFLSLGLTTLGIFEKNLDVDLVIEEESQMEIYSYLSGNYFLVELYSE
ncbi:MAG: hypothetical protein H7A24_00860 [Leptospiraceae bacterium]|nr:hypothetical protein [Leptospiraceae bacterium]MCP5510401.1 hypothetical protein [Leptospiraceae bacterium]